METVDLPAIAGCIAYGDDGYIWGIGATEADAREDATKAAVAAGCQLDWARIWHYPASKALLDRVAQYGGAVTWRCFKTAGRWAADVRDW